MIKKSFKSESARQPGKLGERALCKEAGEQRQVAATQQQETPPANKTVATSYVPGVLYAAFSMKEMVKVCV